MPPAHISPLQLWRAKLSVLPDLLAGRKWLSIDLINLGIREGLTKPTVVVTAAEADDLQWEPLTEGIKRVFHQNFDAAVFFPQGVVGCEDEEQMSEFSDADECEGGLA